jgi:hypothetical protein
MSGSVKWSVPVLIIFFAITCAQAGCLPEASGENSCFDGMDISIYNTSPLPRFAHSALVFDNKMWIIGGTNQTGELTDVWSSPDGITWTCMNNSAGFPDQDSFRAVVYDNKMWVIAESRTGEKKNDVWYSSDGTIWVHVTDTPGFSCREDFSLLVFDNRMWVIGGNKGTLWKNDVWYSSDGLNWSCANASAAFPGRQNHASFVFNNRMWIVGGTIGSCWLWSNDVWSSGDGIIWTPAPRGAFNPYESFTSLVFRGRMWIFEGDEIWWSADGKKWNRVNTPPAWSGHRISQNKIVYEDRMWVIGGDARGRSDDVWSSTDGISWTRAGTAPVSHSPLMMARYHEAGFSLPAPANSRLEDTNTCFPIIRPVEQTRSCEYKATG